jgi:hypothetical protein
VIETIKREIEGHTYHLHQLGAKQGRQMLVRLTKVLGPSLGRLAELDQERLSEGVAGAIYELSDHLTEADLDWVCETFGKRTDLELEGGKTILLDLEAQELHFAGRYGAMVRWLGACLEVNFRDFFDMSRSAAESAGLGGPGGAARAALSRRSRPESSPGKSGGS